MQSTYWKTLVEWLNNEHNLDVKTTSGILSISQSQKTIEFFRQVLENCDSLQLAAFEKSIMMTKSMIIPFALFKKKINVNTAAIASRLEVLHQIDRWGEVEDSHDTDSQDFKRQLGAVSVVWLKA
jgi:ATP synthase F1 complex assembly factor 2